STASADPTPPPVNSGPPAPLSPAVRVITVVAVVVVAVIAAVVSYSHMQQLADRAGEAWRSWLIPLSIDGLVVAASMVLLTRRRRGMPGGRLAWSALGGGVLASLAANMADARPEITAVLVAGWPAAAFAVAFELLLQQRRAEHTPPNLDAGPAPIPVNPAIPEPHRQETPTWTPTPTSTWSPSLTTTAGTSGPGSAPNNASSSNTTAGSSRSTAAPVDRVSTPIHGRRGAHTHEPRAADPADLAAAALPVSQLVPVVTASTPPVTRAAFPQSIPVDQAVPFGASPESAQADDEELVARVRRLLAGAQAQGRRLGRRAIAAELNVTEHQARVAMELVAAATGPALNGTGGSATATAAGRGGR
ncbi:MAG: DUF2637 domain-containing protein, partial [Pseudonocardiaceae bacterium]